MKRTRMFACLVAFVLLCPMLSLLASASALDSAVAHPADTYYYSQLTAEEKTIYDALTADANLDALKKGVPIAVSKPFTITVPKGVTQEEFNTLYRSFDNEMTRLAALMPSVPNAVAALDRDRSDLFWTTGVQCRVVMQQNGETVTGGMSFSGGNSYTTYLEVTLPLSEDWDGDGVQDRTLADDILRMEQNLLALIKGAQAASSTRYGQLQYLNQALCDYNTYNDAAAKGGYGAHYPWTPLSALDQLTEKDDANNSLKPVCEGYARAFKMACDRLSIPCILISGLGNGENHMWNYVQMEDGKWYGVDVTWNDSTGLVNRYFLVGKDVMSQQHTPDNRVIANQTSAFVAPELADTAYDPTTNTQHTHAYGNWQPHNDRQHQRVCSCGLAEYADHAFGDWTVKKEATEAEVGSRERSCVCGMVERQEIERLTHTYEQSVTPPTCTEGGYTTHTCKNCGDSYRTDATDPTGHAYGTGEACEVCGATRPQEPDTDPADTAPIEPDAGSDTTDTGEQGSTQAPPPGGNGTEQNGFSALLGGCKATVSSVWYVLLSLPVAFACWKKRAR